MELVYGNSVQNFTECGGNDTISRGKAEVAQLVEQLIRNQQVVGSSPTFGSTKFNLTIRLEAT